MNPIQNGLFAGQVYCGSPPLEPKSKPHHSGGDGGGGEGGTVGGGEGEGGSGEGVGGGAVLEHVPHCAPPMKFTQKGASAGQMYCGSPPLVPKSNPHSLGGEGGGGDGGGGDGRGGCGGALGGWCSTTRR
eukprot:7277729-Prymnesium_polylepis.1